ncbi:hypothetical protein SAMD00023353_6700540 [Rosellinia necatrix]|uniref:Lipocalin-like domain-containing protein n=1 Tax=Rosellinia necatrix TaxID=77044 RepID=A0A1W2TTB0_ROSNE|nr:hypothetical protein SAMD00023353_6700540 [Rosellinia necatrix]
MQALKAIRCFTGAWTIINTTLTNETTGEIIPQWHGNYPNGITIYTKWKQTSFLITANDRTHPELRPGELELPAGPTDSDARWALIGKNTLAAGGSYLLSRHLEPEDSEDEDKFRE